MNENARESRVSRRTFLIAGSVGSASLVAVFFGLQSTSLLGRSTPAKVDPADEELKAKFDFLSTHGNSNCSAAFLAAIPSMDDDKRLQGSCCSPMEFNKYKSQIGGLAKHAGVALIPPDPYDIPVALAKRLLAFDMSITPTRAEQAVLDEAVAASDEKGYCCCNCWRWNTYEGLSRYLVRDQHFVAGQITDVLNNSNGCGGGM